MKLHVLIACHNRRLLTLHALRSVTACAEIAHVGLDITVFDDGSIDGTREAVVAEFPDVYVMPGDGSAFWASAMSAAESAMMARHDGVHENNEYVVWLNDDVDLDSDALVRMVPLLRSHPNSVLIGATRDPDSGAITYSGFQRYGRHPLHYGKVQPSEETVQVDTFNGNFVCVPIAVAKELGGIDGEYSHAWADIDYGFRCRRLGVPMLLAPGTFGSCRLNLVNTAPIRIEWSRFTGPKGAGNVRSLRRLLSRHGGPFWRVFFIGTYLLWWVRHTTRSL